MTVSKSKQNANRKWNEENLDRIYLTMKKGEKDKIKAFADSSNMSLNAFINEAIKEKIKKEE